MKLEQEIQKQLQKAWQTGNSELTGLVAIAIGCGGEGGLEGWGRRGVGGGVAVGTYDKHWGRTDHLSTVTNSHCESHKGPNIEFYIDHSRSNGRFILQVLHLDQHTVHIYSFAKVFIYQVNTQNLNNYLRICLRMSARSNMFWIVE